MSDRKPPTMDLRNHLMASEDLSRWLVDQEYLKLCCFRGKLFALKRFIFTWAIVEGLNTWNYERRFCYQNKAQAVVAWHHWTHHPELEKPIGYVAEK